MGRTKLGMTRLALILALLALPACTPLGKVADCMANPNIPCEDKET